jgi:response regulator RpfG family c-di-GMP phosphodiesterase
MSAKARVLFVDDEERIVNLLKIMFRMNYEVFTATNGNDALNIIAQQHIHVIVSDQRMPEMMGIDLLTKVRERSPDTMRILLTGYSDLSAIVGSVNDGEVFRFINKPWDQEEIKSILHDAVQIALVTDSKTVRTPSRVAATVVGAAPLRREVLLLDDNAMDRHWASKMLEADYRVHEAASIPDALKILAQHDISVMVSEVSVGGQATDAFLNVLKRQYPVVTTVMLTDSADADHVIKLINQAQISRFSTKPIKAGSFTLSVKAAMMQHERFREDPTRMVRHKVGQSKEAEQSPMVAGWGRALASLRSRFNFFS